MNKPKKKPPEMDEKNFDYMKTNKDNINNVLRDEKIKPIIMDLVNRTNKIVIHAYQFLKLYCIHRLKKKKSLPRIDKNLICDIFKAITKRDCNRGGYLPENMPKKLKKLVKFNKKHYMKTCIDDDIVKYDKLSYILPYEAIDMVTNINNNIQEHFISHLNKYINIRFRLKERLSEITKNTKDKKLRKELHKKVYDEINLIKKDMMSFKKRKSDPKYHKWIKEKRKKIYGEKTKLAKDNVAYDIKVRPQFYLKGMFYINSKFEKYNRKIDKSNAKIGNIDTNSIKQIRLFNVLPLRTNIIGKNIIIDTCGLISNFLGNESTSSHFINYKKKNNQYNQWNRFFKLNKRIFKKSKYKFNHMIRTDGISLCALFVRINKNGQFLPKKYKDCKKCDNTDYIENTKITKETKNKKVVCADPGCSDLIYCGSKNEDEILETFRYTQNQRRKEIGYKKYNKIIEYENKKTKIRNKSVKKLESRLCDYNSKTCKYDTFKEYLIQKNKLNRLLYVHYEQEFFRKFKLNRFTNTQKSESKMIKNFSKKFGGPKDTIFIIGDYDKGSYHMKGLESSICKSFRKLFKDAEYETYLVNEYKTSKISNCCHTELEKFMIRPSKKPKYNKTEELCHGLLRCQSVKPKCEIIHNRDKNAVQNMLEIVNHIFQKGNRPSIFRRAI